MNAIQETYLIDTASVAWFLLLWGGYTYYADRLKSGELTLLTLMRRHREAWMERMMARDNRVVDTTIMASIMRSVSLFSSTTLLILAGLLAILGSLDKVQALVSTLPYIEGGTKVQWELKILLMVLIFIYAFFKFAWSLRQFNYAVVLIGAAPLPSEAASETAKTFAHASARVISGGVLNFNRGIRAYYFGLAALSWFLHPVLFVVVTVWVVAVIYRREFMSHTLKLLESVPDMRDDPASVPLAADKEYRP
jgi:uncharacterized membrane protein